MILTVTMNPSVDYTLYVDGLKVGDTNRIQNVERDAGGKGLNVSRIVHQMDYPTVALMPLGGHAGHLIAQVCHQEGVNVDEVRIQVETRTNVQVESNEGPPTTFNSKGAPLTEAEIGDFCESLDALLPSAKWVVGAGSLPTGVSRDFYSMLVRRAKNAEVKVAIDADGELMSQALNERPHLIKPNREEAERLLGVQITNQQEAIDAVRRLSERVDPEGYALLSLGSEGALLMYGGKLYEGTPPPIQPKSTVGAGDSLIGGFLSALCKGCDTAHAFQWGLAAGAATASSDGTRTGRKMVIELLYPDCRVELLG